jgi:hypothetical protein
VQICLDNPENYCYSEIIVLEAGANKKNLGFRVEAGGGRLSIQRHHFYERRRL